MSNMINDCPANKLEAGLASSKLYTPLPIPPEWLRQCAEFTEFTTCIYAKEKNEVDFLSLKL